MKLNGEERTWLYALLSLYEENQVGRDAPSQHAIDMSKRIRNKLLNNGDV